MPGPLTSAVRSDALPQSSATQLYLSQYGLTSNTPIVVTPGFGGTGGGQLPPIQTGSAHFDITITYYCEQAAVEAREV